VDLFLQRDRSAGQPIGDHIDSGKAKPFKLDDLDGQCLHRWQFCISRLLYPRFIVLEEAADERQQARLMVLAVKLLRMPAFEGRFEGKVEEIPMRSCLNADSTNFLAFCSAWLIFQEEIMLKKRAKFERMAR
jgi:hypothetical protein